MIIRIIITLILVCPASITLAQNFVLDSPSERGKESWKNNLSDILLVEGVYNRNLDPQFNEVYNKAGGLHLNYGKHFGNKYHLIFRTGYMGYSMKNKTSDDSGSFSAIPLQFGGRYYVLRKQIMPYFSFINGVSIISQDRDLEGNIDKQTLLRYAWQVGFGIAFKIIKELNVDVAAKYNDSFYKPEAMLTAFEYSLGVSYNLK